MFSNNVGHLITSTIITLQHFAALHHTSPNYTSLILRNVIPVVHVEIIYVGG